MRARRTRRSIRSGSMTCARTFTALAIMENRGRKSQKEFRVAAPATWCGKIRFEKVCSLPETSMRDLAIHGDDLIVATHGRSFWILDDITPLRQMNAEIAKENVHLFTPQEAIRFRWNRNPDTPLPPEFPAGKNPPDGAIIDYYLASAAKGPVTLDIVTSEGV